MLRSTPLVPFVALLLTACGAQPNGEAPWLGAPGDGVWRTATVRVDGTPVELEIEDFDGTYVLEDDIVLDPADVTLHNDNDNDNDNDGDSVPNGSIDASDTSITQGLAAVNAPRTWPNGVVYYRFSDRLPAYMRERVLRAMAAWERKTVVRFEHAGPSRSAFVLIVPFDEPYCRANIGYTGGRTHMWLNDVCSVGIIKHEFGHTLGLHHEQSRQDRNEHVKILWDNIKSGFKGNFYKYRFGRDVGPYNVDSIMQYSSYAFSRNGRPTIVRRDDGTPFGGYRTKIHDLDAEGINRIYAP